MPQVQSCSQCEPFRYCDDCSAYNQGVVFDEADEGAESVSLIRGNMTAAVMLNDHAPAASRWEAWQRSSVLVTGRSRASVVRWLTDAGWTLSTVGGRQV